MKQSVSRGVLAAGLLAGLLSAAAGEVLLPDAGPMPRTRPSLGASEGPAGSRAAMPIRAAVDTDASAFTASIGAPVRASAVKAIAGGLADGLTAVSKGNLLRARAIREGMPQAALDRHILSWAIAMNGGPDVPSGEIARTANALEGWPGMRTLRANGERALYREAPAAALVLSAFGSSRPETPEGGMALARALLETGQAGDARGIIARIWREDRFDRAVETKMMAQFGSLLTKADHKRRMDMLLYADRVADAGRLAKLAGAERLYVARAAASRGDTSAARLFAAVPAAQRNDPGFIFAEVQSLRKRDKIPEAAALLMRAPTDRAALVDPDAWWNERRIVARDLLDLGRPREAYRVASGHSAESAGDAAEAEFHAGWIALSFLKDPGTAARHFARISEISNKPISLSRSYYWLGRASEASGSARARDYYGRAAAYSTTFYGQLAASKLGNQPHDVAYPRPSGAERQRFEGREAVRAIRRLQEIGMESRAGLLYRSLADELDSPGELALLAVMAERQGNHYLALKVGKQAWARGINAPALAFPIGVIPATANISAAGKALAYAIARQESEFNPGAKSGAGALGLLQLMPGTAKSIAKKLGLAYSVARLTSDPGYNATLGSHFLGQQIDDFSGSYVLTFAAYNAGPRRAREWVQRFGDPRGRPVDEVVDWVERIPFTETRNYVQRVMENYQVYKVRLGASSDIERDLVYGRHAG